jgi:hypothetical protein
MKLTEEELIRKYYPLDRIRTFMKDSPSYLVVYMGQGNNTYIRRQNVTGKLEGMFIQSDDWNYNPTIINELNEFKKGYEEIDVYGLYNTYLIHEH